MKYVIAAVIGAILAHLTVCFGNYTMYPDFGAWQPIDRIMYMTWMTCGALVGAAISEAMS